MQEPQGFVPEPAPPGEISAPLPAAAPVTSSFAPPEVQAQPLEAAVPPVATPAVAWENVPPASVAPALAPRPVPTVLEPIAPATSRGAGSTNPLLAMLAGALLASFLFGAGLILGRQGSGKSDSVLGQTVSWGGVNPASGNAIVQAVRAVGPAVMNVDTTFGKGPDTNYLPSPGQDIHPREGKGTGVVFDSKRGLMLTNAHVVADAQKIQVTTRDGDKYTGKVLGIDRRSDIAVVELSNKKLPQARLATFKDARELPIGDWAIAIGNPFAQENTVTVGVISAVGRTLPVPSNGENEAFALSDMLQTDAAINPGNSGGPLCNLRGEVIGINTAIIPYGQGLGFSIPINKAKMVADELIKFGKVQHPYIGVYVKPVTDALQQDYGLPDKNGALVQSVEKGSPADAAGLLPGDVIRKIDSTEMKSHEDVVKAIGGRKVGESLKIEVLRNNAVKKTLTLKVGDRPGK